MKNYNKIQIIFCLKGTKKSPAKK